MTATNRYLPKTATRGRWLSGTALGAAAVWALTSAAALGQVLPSYSDLGKTNGITIGTPANGQLTVMQAGETKSFINWDSFSIGAGGVVNFEQPDASSIILNRDMSGQLSTINGTINANGQIWILNPNGALIGSAGQINARGFLATTHAITNENFEAGDYTFTDAAANLGYGNFAEVVNLGTINVGSGYAILAGREVRNGDGGLGGNIFADLGRVVLAGAPTFTIGLDGDKLLTFAVSGEFDTLSGGNPLVSNLGRIRAVGGRVLMTARAAEDIVDSVINVSGIVNASTARFDEQGNITLEAPTSGEIVVDGGSHGAVQIADNGQDPLVGGVLDVNSPTAVSPGTITILGQEISIGVNGQAKLLASSLPGAAGGAQTDAGTISIGRGLAGTEFENAPLAERILIGKQDGTSNFDPNPAIPPLVEIQARAFGGTGRKGGNIVLYTESGSNFAEAEIRTSGFIDVQASGNFNGEGGASGEGGTVEVVTQRFTLRPSGTITANSVTNGANGGGGGIGGTVAIAAQRIVTEGDHTFIPDADPNDGVDTTVDRRYDTRISASGNIQGGDLFIGAKPDGSAAVAGGPLAREIWIDVDSSLRASAFDLSPGSTGGNIVVRTATDDSGPTPHIYIDGGLSARGGNGGTIETVSRRVQITGTPEDAGIDSVRSGIDAGGYAPGGANGAWLISGNNLIVGLNPVTARTPDWVTGEGTSALIDRRVLSGALGAFVGSPNGPIFGATDVTMLAAQYLSIQGPIAMGGARDVALQLFSDNDIDIFAGITAGNDETPGKLDVSISAAGAFRFIDDGLQGPGNRAIFTNGGTVGIEAASVEIGAGRIIDSSTSTAAGAIDIVGATSVDLKAGGGIYADGFGPSGVGGTIRIAGGAITIDGNGTADDANFVPPPPAISASGDAGGGTIRIGGDMGGTPLPDQPQLASSVLIRDGAGIYAEVFSDTGNGGTIAVWSTGGTTVEGRVSARSALGSGDGGTIEIGGNSVAVLGNARVDVGADGDGGDIRLIGDAITVNTFAITEQSPRVKGLFAAGFGGDGGTISIGGGSGGTSLAGKPLPTSVTIAGGSRMNVNSIFNPDLGTGGGAAGRITIWSDLDNPLARTSIAGGSFAAERFGEGFGYGGLMEVGGYQVTAGNFLANGGLSLTASDHVAVNGAIGPAVGTSRLDLAIDAGRRIDLNGPGSITTNGGDIMLALTGDSRSPDLNNGIYSAVDLATNGGTVSFYTPGSDVSFDTPAGSVLNIGGWLNSTSGGDLTINAGGGSQILLGGGFIETYGGDLTVLSPNASLKVSADIRTEGNVEVGSGLDGAMLMDVGQSGSIQVGDGLGYGSLFAGYGGDIELSAGTLGIEFASFAFSAVQGDDIRLNADSMRIAGFVTAANSIGIAPITASRNIKLGGSEDDATRLSLTEFELNYLETSIRVIGHAQGTGAIDIDVTESEPPAVSLASFSEGCWECEPHSPPPSMTIVKTGGTITASGQSSTDANETIRLIAGSGITLAQGFHLDLLGKIELISGGAFTNEAGAAALTTMGSGQWLIHSATPTANSFGGLLSGQKALWGQSFADLAADGRAHSGNLYSFGLIPTLTVAVANKTKTYGDAVSFANPVAGVDYTVSGLVDAAAFGGVFLQDSFSGGPSLASSGAGATADAGRYSIVAGAGSSFAAPTGYNVSFLSGTLTVDPRLLTASLVGNVSKIYDGGTAAALSSANYSLAGFVNGDEASVSVANTAGSYADKNAGTGKAVTVNGVALTGDKAGNYVLSNSALTANVGTITPKALTGSLAVANKTYDGTTAAQATISFDGLIAGDAVAPSGGTIAFADKNAGTGKAVNATGLALTGADAGNYTLTIGAATADITPKALTASLTGGVSKVYDGTAAASLGAGNYAITGFIEGEGATVNQTSGSFASPNVGSGIGVSASLAAANFAANQGTDLGNYLMPTSANGAIGTITPATLTYLADLATRAQGAANPTLSGSVAGFVAGESQATATTGTLAFTTPAAATSPTGSYAINGGGLMAANYVFVQAAGNATALTVTPPSAPPPPPPVMEPAKTITTTIQSTIASTLTPPPPPPPPTPTPTPTSSPSGGNAQGGQGGAAPPPTGPTPPPPAGNTPPANNSAPPTGNAPPPPPPPGPPVEPTPPSPVPEAPPETPKDAADEGDPVLASAEGDEEPEDAPQEKRQYASTTTVAPGINVETPTPPRAPEVPGAEQSFSGTGNPAQW